MSDEPKTAEPPQPVEWYREPTSHQALVEELRKVAESIERSTEVLRELAKAIDQHERQAKAASQVGQNSELNPPK